MRGRAQGERAADEAEPFEYGRIADLYDTWFRLMGFKRGVEQFLDRVEWRLPAGARVLDAGAGTGILGLWFLARFPDSEVIAFDIDRQMLAVLGRSARRLGQGRRRLIVAQGDLRAPDVLTRLDSGQALALVAHSFDAVLVGAALEHAPLDTSIGRLARLLRPGGVFLNLGVRPGPTATVLARLYRFRPYAPAEILASLHRFGFVDVRVLPLTATEFPANLTRVGVIARKS
jgi:ubiquinone/menaquinone biosynthesis C-methylase UbiE